MSSKVLRIGPIQFHHEEDFKGDVRVVHGTQEMLLPVDALRQFVAESVREELMTRVLAMDRKALLHRIA